MNIFRFAAPDFLDKVVRASLPAVVLPAVVLAAAGCATLERDEVAAPPDGGAVTLRTGTALVVSLPPDPATGYGWVLKSGSPNLSLVGAADYTPSPKAPGLVGVAETTAFRFRAGPPGAGTLEFVWTSPPGAPPAPERAVRYDVTIGPPLPLVTNLFGTVGIDGAPGGSTSTGGNARNPVKYWAF
ncbi:MAG: protease inhibitor I42 family protein [Burkholderiales bacterium]|nr:protease inhibitor I42 family protein [Burkholderiales bacterium]